jgi:hypothetical protein
VFKITSDSKENTRNCCSEDKRQTNVNVRDVSPAGDLQTFLLHILRKMCSKLQVIVRKTREIVVVKISDRQM